MLISWSIDYPDQFHRSFAVNALVSMARVLHKRFSYDAAGNAAAVNHDGTYYYYLRNGQGDIVKLIDGSGATVVEYIYDSWGKPLSCTGTLATTLGVLNPFRYRGYVYDEETGFYYLKSRYYDPEVCRFISSDVLLSTGQGVIGHNCYAYCGNNPISWIDPAGTDIEDVYEWLKDFFGAEARTTYRQRTRNLRNSAYLFIIDIESGTERSIVKHSSGNSSKPVSVYAEARADDFTCSSAGLCINISNMAVDVSLGLDNTGVTFGYDRGNGSSWSSGWSLNLKALEFGMEHKETVSKNDSESASTYVNISFTGYGLLYLYAILNGDFQFASSPDYAWGY